MDLNSRAKRMAVLKDKVTFIGTAISDLRKTIPLAVSADFQTRYDMYFHSIQSKVEHIAQDLDEMDDTI